MCSPIVTTSWDDGDPRDMRIAEMLAAAGLAGTFYVPIVGYRGMKTLAEANLLDLSRAGYEIGAHTVSHISLTKLGPAKIRYELHAGKQMLEQILGAPVSMFCYPNGRYDSEVLQEVRNTGYAAARTTRMLSVKRDFPPFEMPTTLQAYPHRKTAYVKNLSRGRNLHRLANYVIELSNLDSWTDLGKRLFDRVLASGGVWHLYGHSWEIDELGIWDELRLMLEYVSHRKGVSYLTNGDVVSSVSPKRDSLLM
jgi:hypothetical protein